MTRCRKPNACRVPAASASAGRPGRQVPSGRGRRPGRGQWPAHASTPRCRARARLRARRRRRRGPGRGLPRGLVARPVLPRRDGRLRLARGAGSRRGDGHRRPPPPDRPDADERPGRPHLRVRVDRRVRRGGLRAGVRRGGRARVRVRPRPAAARPHRRRHRLRRLRGPRLAPAPGHRARRDGLRRADDRRLHLPRPGGDRGLRRRHVHRRPVRAVHDARRDRGVVAGRVERPRRCVGRPRAVAAGSDRRWARTGG
jgi:hypothetical protein